MDWYYKNTDKQLKGRKVKTLVDLRNGWCNIPAGTVAVITRKFQGLSLEAERCEKCGVAIKISRVSPKEIILLPLA